MLRLFMIIICFMSWLSSAIAQEPIQPLPQTLTYDIQKAKLGERLFHEPRLSSDNTISCNSCHNLAAGGIDHEVVAIGIHGQKGLIRTLTVYNSVFNIRLFWNGRAKDLQSQAKEPITNPKEMGSQWADVINKLKQDPSYVQAFKQTYGDITIENIVEAISEYEHSLITPSRFDDYLRGNKDAITAQEKHGYELFKSYGCITCHNGINVGGGMFQKMGVMKNYFQERGTPITSVDFGLYQVSKQEKDKFVFRVPSLRNVTILAPYFHDGSAKTLDEAILKMGIYQLGIRIPDKDRHDIAAFLNSLTGKIFEKPVKNNLGQ